MPFFPSPDTASCALPVYLRKESGFEGKPTEKKRAEEELEKEKNRLLCRLCKTPITSQAHMIVVNGSTKHVFANPSGIVYEIGCFSAANGCINHGLPTQEFTWFAGYSWRFSFCRGCQTHMGWVYLGEEGSGFFGLILDKLIPESS